MHLPRNSWSRNGRNTIESRAGAYVVLGQQRGLSVVDKQQLNQLYKCSNNYGKKFWYVLNVYNKCLYWTVPNCNMNGTFWKLVFPLGCYHAVGLEKGKIRDSQLRASSSNRGYEPHQARLHLTAGSKGNGAWCARRNAFGQYLQVNSPHSIYQNHSTN